MSIITARNLNMFYKEMKGNSLFHISFVNFYEGDTYTITTGTDVITGQVPEDLEVVVAVKKLNASYTISATHSSVTYYTTIQIGQFYGSFDIILKASVLDNIVITTSLSKTTYNVGEYLDLNGLQVTATYEDTTTADVTSKCTYNIASNHRLTTSDTTLTVSYSESGVTKTANITLTITNVDISSLESRVSTLESSLSQLSQIALIVTPAEEEEEQNG